MKLYKNKKFWIGATISCLLFTSLIVYRTLFYKGTLKFNGIKERVNWSYKPLNSSESWMNIFQNFKKIGFTHRTLENLGNGYQINEKSVMKINTMGMVQEIYVDSKSTTDMDFAIKKFDFKVASGSFNFSVNAHIKDNILYIQSSDKLVKDSDSKAGRKPEVIKMPLENRPYLTSGIIQATLASGLEKDQEMVLFVFDPSTLGQAPATVKVEGSEDIGVNDRRFNAQKVSLSFKGARQFAWLNDEGEVLKEQGLLGITLIKTDKKGALEGTPVEQSDDLTALVSIKSNKTFEKPENLTQITFKISGIDELNTDLTSERQKLDSSNLPSSDKSRVITIVKESLDGIADKLTPDITAQTDIRFRQPDAFIQSNDYRIKSFAFKALSSSQYLSYSNSSFESLPDTPLEKVEKFVAWIQKNIKRQPVISLPNALSTLENRVGDCNEHAALFAAFCRAVGIPAKIEAGVVYLNGSFYYHAWNSVFLGRWITVDSLFNQIPADVTHIAFSSGSQEMQLDILGLIGRVKIEVLDYK